MQAQNVSVESWGRTQFEGVYLLTAGFLLPILLLPSLLTFSSWSIYICRNCQFLLTRRDNDILKCYVLLLLLLLGCLTCV